MKSTPITRQEVVLIMADLHNRLNHIGKANGGLKAYQGLCLQLAIAVPAEPPYYHEIPHYRDKRARVLSDLMRGWARRNPTLGRGAKRSEGRLIYPILPWGADVPRIPPCMEGDVAARKFSAVLAWGTHMAEPTGASRVWPPTKPDGYEDYIVARLNLLAYLQDTVARALARLTAQELQA